MQRCNLLVNTSVYNLTTKAWIAPSEPVDDVEEGTDRAAEYARAYLKHAANADLPLLRVEEGPVALKRPKAGAENVKVG